MNHYQIFSKFFDMTAREKCLDCIGFIEKGASILDLGCGSGIIAKNFQDFFGAKVVGVDIKDNRIFPIPFKNINGKALPFRDKSFDIVLISYVLHHSQDPTALLQEAKRVGKKIIIYEDVPEDSLSRLRCSLHQMTYNFLFEQKEKCNFKSENEWKKIFKKLGLKIIAQKRVSTYFDRLDPVFKKFFILEKI